MLFFAQNRLVSRVLSYLEAVHELDWINKQSQWQEKMRQKNWKWPGGESLLV